MRIALARFLAVFAWAVALAGAPVGAQPLVSAEALRDRLAGNDVLLIDASSTRLFAAKHIPGAVNVDLYAYGSPHKVTTAEIERRFQSWGVSPGRKIVIYDEGASMTATWLFYELHYHGFPLSDLSILDGGLARWEAIGGAVTREPTPAPAQGTFRITALNEGDRVRLDEFLVASGDPARHALVEALEPQYHYGGTKFFDRAGHVPNAAMLPTGDFYNADKTFKSPAEIRKMASYLGIGPDRHVHSYCGGGVAATVPWFALKMLSGYPSVKVYKESQLEWLQDERGLPLWTYGAPYLKRDAAWLAGWNGRMLRMYGVTRLAIVDVRPADAYRENHVPFALSVPADVFRRHLDDPAKLAAILGPAGIDPAHEAVIVSAGGLNPASALAFVALERVGQRKVSVLMESVDDWGLRGFPLTKEPTPVGPKKSPMDPAIAPVAFAPAARAGVVVTDARTSAGPYPKVFVASGAKLPDKRPAGDIVHVPWTDLVASDGTPKPAHAIWTILAKAGVPRYAELVLIADDPGEAAVNYFVLKLMGFPDVKVLL